MNMTRKNDWYKRQPRGGNKPYRFTPKWTTQTVLWIIDRLNDKEDFVDIQVKLIKDYGIGMRSAGNWIEMARRIMTDLNNGVTIGNALARDEERRNMMRRKKATS